MKRLVVFATAIASTASAQPQPNAQAVLANVQKFYASAKQMTARFHQDVTNATFGNTLKSDGDLYVLKPMDLRFDYALKTSAGKKPDKTIVFDGSTGWLIDHKNKTLYQTNVQNPVLPAAMSFLTGGGNIASQFNLAIDTTGKYGSAGMIVVALTPKQASAQYKQLFFVVDPSDWHINESIVIDANGDTNDFHFYAPDLQKPIGAQLFHVNPASLPLYRVVQPNATAPAPAAPPPTRKPTPTQP